MTLKLWSWAICCGLLVTNPAFGDDAPTISPELKSLFERLDELGRDRVAKAKFVSLTLESEREARQSPDPVWLIDENDASMLVLAADLLPWRYSKKGATTLPDSWQPREVVLKSVKEADFEAACKQLAEPPQDEEPRRRLGAAGPSRRLLAAHAAWKKGLTKYVEPILRGEPAYKQGFAEFQKAALEDLAWLHFLRGVNLLMFADRREVLPQLKLSIALAPESEFAPQAKDLVKRLEPIVAQEQQPQTKPDYSKLNNDQLAEAYIAQIKNLHSPQFSQPGFIDPYSGVVVGQSALLAPTMLLKQLGDKAVPALIKALEDDTPTRTVYHWRDFARNRVVWRVSDFAWCVLRDITGKELGDRRQVGFTFSYMSPEQKKAIIAEVTAWQKTGKNQTPDERMLAMLAGPVAEEWFKAGAYFLKKKDRRAVKPLLDQLSHARGFEQGKLCMLIAKFGDPVAKDGIASVMRTAKEPSDRLGAAIALHDLGDAAGIPIAIEFVKAKDQAYGRWEEPVWFLMYSRSPEGLKTLKDLVANAPAERASEVIEAMLASISGELSSSPHAPAGCAEVYPIFLSTLSNGYYTGMTINDIKMRTKDRAANGLALLKVGAAPGARRTQIDANVFNELEPDEAKRDAQIDELKRWYDEHAGKLEWDKKRNRLSVRD